MYSLAIYVVTRWYITFIDGYCDRLIITLYLKWRFGHDCQTECVFLMICKIIGSSFISILSIYITYTKRRKGWYSIIRKHMFQYLRNPEQMFIASGIFMDEMQSYNYRIDSLFGKVGFYLACVLRRIRK